VTDQSTTAPSVIAKRKPVAPPVPAEPPLAQKIRIWTDLSGEVLAKIVAAGMFLGTGAEVFHLIPDFIDPTRAQDVFTALAGYYGIPFLVSHQRGKGTRR
jgi:hypothetical protein